MQCVNNTHTCGNQPMKPNPYTIHRLLVVCQVYQVTSLLHTCSYHPTYNTHTQTLVTAALNFRSFRNNWCLEIFRILFSWINRSVSVNMVWGEIWCWGIYKKIIGWMAFGASDQWNKNQNFSEDLKSTYLLLTNSILVWLKGPFWFCHTAGKTKGWTKLS